jgi:lysophospholipase L1-like esterase
LRIAAGAALVVSFLVIAPGLSAQAGRGDHWISTWGTAVVPRNQGPQGGGRGAAPGAAAGAPQAAAPGQAAPGQAAPGQAAPGQAVPGQAAPGGPAAGRGGNNPAGPPLNFNNQTIRQTVRVSLGGDRLRVVLSNAFGTQTMTIGAAQVAIRQKDSTLVPNTNRPLTFDGRPTANIASGAIMVSDPVTLTVPSLADVAIDLYIPGDTGASMSPLTTHGARQTNYVSTTGNHVGEVAFPVTTETQGWWFLSRVEVTASAEAATIVALGDSITDGNGSTTDTYNRWPDLLAKRLVAANLKMGVVNVGIGGNRVIGDAGNNASTRFDRDVLAQTGVAYVVLMEGINDLRNPGAPPVTELITAHKQLIERAHARGLKIIGATILPIERDENGGNGFNPTSEAARQSLNQWIRTAKAYDGVIDFESVMKDPARPTRLIGELQSGDWLHPNDAGYQKMIGVVDLSLFRGVTPSAPGTD